MDYSFDNFGGEPIWDATDGDSFSFSWMKLCFVNNRSTFHLFFCLELLASLRHCRYERFHSHVSCRLAKLWNLEETETDTWQM